MFKRRGRQSERKRNREEGGGGGCGAVLDTLYFGLILLKADRISQFHSSQGQCACVPLSISPPPSPPFNLSLFLFRLSFRFVFSQNVCVTWLRERQSISPRALVFLFSFFFYYRKTAHWDAVICPQFDHKWSPQRGCLLAAPSFFPRALVSFFFFFFIRLLLLSVTLRFASARYIAAGSNGTHRGNVEKPEDSQRAATPLAKMHRS